MFLIFMITGICVAMIIVFWINPKSNCIKKPLCECTCTDSKNLFLNHFLDFIPLNYIPIAIVSCGSLVIILCLLTIMVYMTKLVRGISDLVLIWNFMNIINAIFFFLDDYPCLLWLLLLIDCIILIATVAVVILVNVYCSGESNLKLIAELNYSKIFIFLFYIHFLK